MTNDSLIEKLSNIHHPAQDSEFDIGFNKALEMMHSVIDMHENSSLSIHSPEECIQAVKNDTSGASREITAVESAHNRIQRWRLAHPNAEKFGIVFSADEIEAIERTLENACSPKPVSVTHDETLNKLAREYHRRLQKANVSLPDWDSDREDNKQWCRDKVIEEWFPILTAAGVPYVD